MKTDIQIAQEAQMKPIKEVAETIGIQEDDLELYGKYKAKLSDELWDQIKDRPDGKLVLVTAINPTPAGEGKTTTSVGLGQAMAKLNKKAVIALREDVYKRQLQNPTNDAVAAKICDLEGGVAAMLTSSGQAANFYAIMNIAEAGDHILCASALYGGTYNLYAHTLKKMGIEATFVDPDAGEEELHAAFQENTKAVFGETISCLLYTSRCV